MAVQKVFSDMRLALEANALQVCAVLIAAMHGCLLVGCASTPPSASARAAEDGGTDGSGLCRLIDAMKRADTGLDLDASVWVVQDVGEVGRLRAWMAQPHDGELHVVELEGGGSPLVVEVTGRAVYGLFTEPRAAAVRSAFETLPSFVSGRDVPHSTTRTFAGIGRRGSRIAAPPNRPRAARVLERLAQGPADAEVEADFFLAIEFAIPWVISRYYPAQ